MTIGTDLYDTECIPEYFCLPENNIDWTVNYESDISLNNWIKKYAMYCDDYTLISAFGMAYYAGFTFGNLIIPPLSDKRGRKNWYLACQLVQTLSTLVIVCLPGTPEAKHYAVPIIVAMFFIHGNTSTGTQLIGYCMILDTAPEHTHAWISGIWAFSEGLVYISLTLFFKYIDKDTRYPLLWSIF